MAAGGGGGVVTVTGTNATVMDSFYGSNTVIIGDHASAAVIAGGDTIEIASNNATLALSGDNDSVAITGAGAHVTLAGSGDTVMLGGGASVTTGGGHALTEKHRASEFVWRRSTRNTSRGCCRCHCSSASAGPARSRAVRGSSQRAAPKTLLTAYWLVLTPDGLRLRGFALLRMFSNGELGGKFFRRRHILQLYIVG
jgi:hypothetical protein